ncbi:beta-glucoside-specific PTS transporter subunit IIABC [Lactobacillus sp.]|uniref:beta-glucoside-specific PTS transporter subunit IIABC n=1 Tax=Lactobacillus sp. TaxID=1591 RepID=UPI0025E97154|nr:beta-glucoside-specific PTS transporter subunit IIABC [Lactobacillus sp.]MCO6535193.1 PTS glucose transporter subunit IIA [Lactobacillus sp.]
MSAKDKQLAQRIVELIGGKENVNDAWHCQTRLRFKLVDESKAETEKIKELAGVINVLSKGGVYQIVIGPNVADVFEELEPLLDLNQGSEQKEKTNIGAKIIDFVSGVFQPIIPALSGAGMVKAVLALLVVFKAVNVESATYQLLNMLGDTIFYFLPVFLAFTEARKLKCNQIIAAAVATVLVNPTWLSFVTAGKPVNLFNVIPFHLVNYAYSVIPIILIVFVQSYIEHFLNKLIPKAVELVFVPMLTLLIMGILALSVLGPIGDILGGYLSQFFTYLSVNASWAPALLVGGLLPVMVMFGLHNGIAPLGVMQMATKGYDSIFGPGCVVSNMCSATAALVVALRTRDQKTKELGFSSSITAYMGITEPALYGINLPKRYPLIAAMIGGAFGGLYAGLTHTHRFATGSSGLPAVLLYIGDNTLRYLINILIAMVIGVVITAVLTYLLSLKYETNDKKKVQLATEPQVVYAEISSPVKGELLPLSQSDDEAFASQAMGKGFVVKPSEGKVYAPVDGKVVSLFSTKHAIGILGDNGAEILIHIGIDTVDLKGKYFTAHVKQGQKVTKGQLLIEFDRSKITASGYNDEIMVIITNTNSYQNVELLDSATVTDLNKPILQLMA